MQSHGLIEFAKLKEEQINRIKFRDGLFYFTMLIIGGALSLALTSKDARGYDILLAVPFAVFVAGVAHIAADRRIDDIGIYIRDNLSKSVADELMVEKKDVFLWENAFPGAPLHITRDILRICAGLMLYVGSGVAALFFYGVLQEKSAIEQLTRSMPTAPLGNVTSSALTYGSWQYHVAWAGAYLMVVMLTIFIMFNAVKWTRPKITFDQKWNVWMYLRVLLSLSVAVGIGLLVYKTAELWNAGIGAWFGSPQWQQVLVQIQTPFALTVVCLALCAGAVTYLITRRNE